MKAIRNLCLWLLLTAALTMPVLAAGAGMTLEVSVATANAGDTFTVEAVLENDKAVALGTVALEYDEKVFELVGGTCLLDNAMFGEVLLKEKAGTFLLMLPRKVSGPVFAFTFRVKTNAAPGTYKIGAEASVGDSQGSNVAVKGAEIQIGTQVPTVTPNEKPTEPKPPVQVAPPTTGEPAHPKETAPTTEQTRPGEAVQATEQTQPILPTQSQGQPETILPTVGAEPTKNTDGSWWILIPLVLGCGIAVILIQKKKKA